MQNKYKADLMERIISLRYTDLEEEAKCCKQLLEAAEADGDNYGCAFANVYLLDSHLGSGDFTECDFYLIRAAFLCGEHDYADLKSVFCNFAGLYYLKLGDEQLALEYYLQGLKNVRRVGDYDAESKLLNNIGISFAERGAWEVAKYYFGQAFAVTEPHMELVRKNNTIGFLSNLAEACQNLGDAEGSRTALVKCEEAAEIDPYQQLQLSCGWCAHYAIQQEWEQSLAIAERILEQDLMDFTQKYFVCDMCIRLCEAMLQIDNKEKAAYFLNYLESISEDVALIKRYRFQCLKISYGEKYGSPRQQEEAYQGYFEIINQMAEMEGKARAQSMISQIQLTSVVIEREAMKQKNRELELVGQLDDLTGLYNRRYFNKLISKLKYDYRVKKVGVIMLDVDYFKQYNDFYGHFKGDDVLKTVAAVLAECSKTNIYVGRYGGDEFICLCVGQTDLQVEECVRSIHTKMKKHCIPHEKSPVAPYVTLSIGYCNEDISHIDELYLMADQALYQVKQSGRNDFKRKTLE